MTDTLTLSDPIVVHDRRPTHPAKPLWLVEAQSNRDYAWRCYNDLVAAMFDDAARPVDHTTLDAARAAAYAADAWYSDLYQMWQEGREPLTLSECGCVLPGQSCSTCRDAGRVELSEAF
jgi:hypothetical protein